MSDLTPNKRSETEKLRNIAAPAHYNTGASAVVAFAAVGGLVIASMT